MSERYDLVRLAELRDAHSEKVSTYRRSTDQVRQAAQDATRARLDAPPLVGAAPTMARHAFAPGIGHAVKPPPVRAKTNDFYLLPLAILRTFTPEQLDKADVDHRALSRILAAETRLERLRVDHGRHAAAVRESAAFMRGIELFSLENRL